MSDKYPQKLQLIDALVIRDELLGNVTSTNDPFILPYLIMQKIMMFDYRRLPMFGDDGEAHIHPMDSFLALLHCCDNILRQDMLCRLSTCQLAVPFLLPDPSTESITLLLWGIRSIVREWTCKEGTSVIAKEHRIVDYNAPLVAFVRIGNAQCKNCSKSQILNSVIGDQDFYFHWDCLGGDMERQFVSGLVELCSYYPSAKSNDAFSDAVFFLNLRGEACNHPVQVDFLKEVCFMSFVLLLEKDLHSGVIDILNKFSSAPGGLVIIFPDYKATAKLKNAQNLLTFINEKGITMVDIKNKNNAYVRSKIQQIISQNISKVNKKAFKTISNVATIAAKKFGIEIDEENQECSEGQKLACNLMDSLYSVNPTEAKAQMLPLQGPNLWHDWAKLDKLYYRPPEVQKTVEYHKKSIEQQKQDVRSKQLKLASNLSPVMKSFIANLYNTSNGVKVYFLHWLKLYLDDRSRTILPGMHAKYEETRLKVKELRRKENHESSKDMNDLINTLKKQNKDLVEGSLGLEHLFRELGQIYEAAIANSKLKSHAAQYPVIAVDMLNKGYPVELMDGDASHIPITWVTAVLNQLKEFHKGKKVFIISVLGIQSTGKSTLLNTMFGLQFNVSAGRCTRGAFLQLLPLSNRRHCDYVLIVDTEGLRAPELSSNSEESNKHDNELATFVIGLADVTIINILGEAPGDLSDILQTAVHAFIRMKKVDMELSCHFVHQNVTVTQSNKLKMGKEGFLTNLNSMTRDAAKAEHSEIKFRSFQDVIRFDETEDITNFPGLWKGDPPMAPVNPGYSDSAQKLKNSLLLLTKSKVNSNFATFLTKVERLWVAVCRENYIFSFKNTLEVTAYNELDAKFSEWSWMLHRKMSEWQLETANAIKNSSLVDKVAAKCLMKANEMLNEIYTDLLEKMNHFFENSERSETLAQWRGRYKIRLGNLKDDSLTEAQHHCDFLKISRHDHLKLKDIEKNHRQQLLQQISGLVSKSKGLKKELTREELEKLFDEKWNQWMNGFNSDKRTQMYASEENIEYHVVAVLQELLKKDNSILIPKLTSTCILRQRGKEHGLTLQVDVAKHLTCDAESNEPSSSNTGLRHKVAEFFGIGGSGKKEEDRSCKEAIKLTEEMLIKAKNMFRKVQRDFQNFDKSSVFTLLSEFIEMVKNYNHQKFHMFTTEYVVDMAITFAGYLTVEFIYLMEGVRTTNDPISKLNKCRAAYFATFMDQYKEISGDEAAANGLCQILAVAVETALVDALPNEIANKIRHGQERASFSQKNYFKVKVLTDLAKRKKFKLYAAYLSDIQSSFEYWTGKYVRDYCTENQGALLIETAKSIVGGVFNKITETATKLPKGITLKSWLQQLHSDLSQDIVFNVSEMQDILEVNSKHAITNNKFFIEALIKGLKLEEVKLIAAVANPQSKFFKITKWNKSPHHILYDKLIGCSAQCPFCKEQCEITDKNHILTGKKHYITVHRPDCLGKYTWEESNELCFGICSDSVVGDNRFRNHDTNDQFVPYKDYKTYYPDWLISNESQVEPKYWQWFIYNNIDAIIEWAAASPSSKGACPAEWRYVNEDEAIKSLAKIYGLL